MSGPQIPIIGQINNLPVSTHLGLTIADMLAPVDNVLVFNFPATGAGIGILLPLLNYNIMVRYVALTATTANSDFGFGGTSGTPYQISVDNLGNGAVSVVGYYVAANVEMAIVCRNASATGYVAVAYTTL